jgi:hypothetical protein
MRKRAKRSQLDALLDVQRVIRGFLGRIRAIKQLNSVYEKILDPTTGVYYYYNSHTDAASWQVTACCSALRDDC